MTTATTNDAGATRALIFALLALACGHMLSTLLRTIPAVSLDLMAADFGIEPQALASLTSVYHFAFAASQIPVGAAMDPSACGRCRSLCSLAPWSAPSPRALRRDPRALRSGSSCWESPPPAC